MDRRKEENIRVRTNITNALFDLLQRKSFSDITITEIIRKSGVARASFYRNYTSKEDVLMKLISGILEQFREEADYNLEDYMSYRHVLRCFVYFKKYERYVLDLYQSGFGIFLLEELNHFHESIAGVMKVHSLSRYQLYMYIGALYNTAIVWLQSEEQEPAEEIARIFCQNMFCEK